MKHDAIHKNTGEHMTRKKKKYMPDQIFGLALLGLLFLIAAALPVHAVNPIFNNSGTYYNDTKIDASNFAATVCKSINADDNFVKRQRCTYVCKYDDLNCSRVINTAINFTADHGGGLVGLSGGNFTIGDYIVPRSGVCLVGAGWYQTGLIKAAGYSGANADTIRQGTNPTPYGEGFCVRDLFIDGTNDSSGTGIGINVKGYNGVLIDHVRIINVSYYGLNIGTATGAEPYVENNQFSNIIIEHNRNQDAIGGGGLRHANFENIIITKDGNTENNSFFDVLNMDDFQIQGMYFNGQNPTSTMWGLAGDYNWTNGQISDIFVTGSNYCLYIGYGSSNITGRGITCLTTRQDAIVLDGLTAATPNISDIHLSDITVRDCGTSGYRYAMLFKRASNVTIENIDAKGNNCGLARFENGNDAENDIVIRDVHALDYTVNSGGTLPTNMYVEGYLYQSLPTCAVGGFYYAKSILYSNSGSIQFKACTNGGWTTTGTGNISGAGTSGYVPVWNSASLNASTVLYDAGSKVGIGTTGPLQLLSINGSGARMSIQTTTTSGPGIEIYNSTGTRNAFIFIDPTDSFKIKINDRSTTQFSMSQGGNLGLGTTGPTQKLDVNGSLNVSGTLYNPGMLVLAGSTVCWNATSNKPYVNTTCP